MSKPGPGNPVSIACSHGRGFNCKRCYPNRDWNILAPYFGANPAGALTIRKPAPVGPSPVEIQAAKLSKALLRKARMIARPLDINIDQDGRDDYWVTHFDFADDEDSDPLNGNHFCQGGAEVLAAVQVYAEALAKLQRHTE
jgi:hypothetical protein